jgi:hypothetical protein
MYEKLTPFAQCVIVYFGQFYLNYRSGTHFWATFSTVTIMYYFRQTVLGYILGNFLPTRLVTLLATRFLTDMRDAPLHF